MRINSLRDALMEFPDFDYLWSAESLPGIESKMRSLLPNWSAEGGLKEAELLTQLGRVQALQGNLPEAQGTLDLAQQTMTAAAAAPDSRVRLRWLLEQGRVSSLKMNPSKAHDFFAEAWTIATKTEQSYFAIDAALMLSTIRPPKFQNEWLKKALELAERAQDEISKRWLAQLLFLEGWHAFDFRQFENALQSFDRALLQPSVVEDQTRAFSLQWSRARVLRELDRNSEALAEQESLLAKMGQFGKISGYVYLEIAECKQQLNLTNEAKNFFELAYAELSADGWYSDNKTSELERMKYLYKKR